MDNALYCRVIDYIFCKAKNGDTTAQKLINDMTKIKHFIPGGCVSVPGPSVSEQLQAELEPLPTEAPSSYPGKYHVG